ncbi:MAG: 50S ribosomal protein L9 [Rhodospirillaceae bacterium]|nr:50S ribosomal protein L9 [Rhodospirillaceae bacterium]
MFVILLERIEKLGQMGDVVSVKAGYARNFLLPQKKALRATKDNIAHFEAQKVRLEADNLTRKVEAEAAAGKMDGASIVSIRQAAESGQLYGSVSSRDIAAGLTDTGFTIDKQQVVAENPIKTLGIHPIRIVLHPEVSVMINVNVARSPEEAQVQAERAARGEDPVILGETEGDQETVNDEVAIAMMEREERRLAREEARAAEARSEEEAKTFGRTSIASD